VLDRARLVGVLRASGRTAPDRIDRGLARFATRQAGGAALLVPSVAEAGDGLSIEIEALEPESGKVLFALGERAVSEEDVLPAVDRLVGRARISLRDREPEVRAAEKEISRAVSSSLQAHQHYLAGVRCVDRPTEAGFSSTAACEGHFRRALAIDPEFPLAHFELARLMYWNEHTAEERRTVLGPAFRNLERLPPREQALVRAWDASMSPDSRREIDILLAAAREFPDDARIAFHLGDALARKGRRPEAAPHLQRAFDLDPGFESAVGTLVWSLGILDRTEDLRRIADRLALMPPSPGTLANEATARAFAGDLTGALGVARRAAPGGAGPARESLEHALVASGRWAEAEAMLREDALRDPGGAPDRLARFLFLRGRTREAMAVSDTRSTSPDPRLRFFANSRQVHQVLDPRRDLEGVRRIADETATWSGTHAARFAFDLAYLGDTARALSLAPLLEDEPGSSALVEALVAWRKDGAAVALPALRRLAHGDPVSAESGPPEAASWFAAECAVEAVGGRSAVDDLHRFQRFYFPLGQFRTWTYPRSLLLEARLLERLGKPAEAKETLARLEDLLSQADADHPLLRDMKALRRNLGAGGRP
jgi:tetratricopeptide (TPR) repeat protein